MRRIVLPLVAAAITTTDVVHTIAAADIRITVEVVIHVDVDVAAAPAATPAPTATPRRANCHTHAKRDCTGGYNCAG
jgi:hypothetical protein